MNENCGRFGVGADGNADGVNPPVSDAAGVLSVSSGHEHVELYSDWAADDSGYDYNWNEFYEDLQFAAEHHYVWADDSDDEDNYPQPESEHLAVPVAPDADDMHEHVDSDLADDDSGNDYDWDDFDEDLKSTERQIEIEMIDNSPVSGTGG